MSHWSAARWSESDDRNSVNLVRNNEPIGQCAAVTAMSISWGQPEGSLSVDADPRLLNAHRNTLYGHRVTYLVLLLWM